MAFLLRGPRFRTVRRPRCCQPDGNISQAEKGFSEARMRGAHRFVIVTLLPASLLAAGAAPAAAQPACSAANAGARICMVGEACTCGYDRGGQLTATPPGWRWSCSLLETCAPPPPMPLEGGQANAYPMVIEPNVQWNQGGTSAAGRSRY
jgi:hypothetical protein